MLLLTLFFTFIFLDAAKNPNHDIICGKVWMAGLHNSQPLKANSPCAKMFGGYAFRADIFKGYICTLYSNQGCPTDAGFSAKAEATNGKLIVDYTKEMLVKYFHCEKQA